VINVTYIWYGRLLACVVLPASTGYRVEDNVCGRVLRPKGSIAAINVTYSCRVAKLALGSIHEEFG
jgi:hypothetical protein